MGIDLETYRNAKGLTYEQLATKLGLRSRRQAMAYAIGENWPSAERIADFCERTGGEVTIEALLAKRLEFLSRKKKGDIIKRKSSRLAITKSRSAAQ